MGFTYQKRERRPLHPSLRKWNRGPTPIKSMNELMEYLQDGRYIFVDGRSAGYHPSFVWSWQVSYTHRLVSSGRLYPGVRNRDMPFVFHAVWHQAANGVEVRSCYFVNCDELVGFDKRPTFTGVSRNAIIKRCRDIVDTFYTGAKMTVTFDDTERK